MPEHRLYRSYLYAPGSSLDLCRKALGAGADAVVFDLEDAVAAEDKATARTGVASLVQSFAASAACAVHVRVNRAGRGYDEEDITSVATPGLDGLRLPKAESPEALQRVDELLVEKEAAAGTEPGSIGLYPIIETATGVLAAGAIADCARVRQLAFGASDYLADVSIPSGSDERHATLFARSQLTVVSRAAGIGRPIDSVHTRLDDLAGLRAAAWFARSLGFFGKSIIHPGQLAAVHEIFTPDSVEVKHAKLVCDAFDVAPEAALSLNGDFVDPAVVARARATLGLATSLQHQGEDAQ